MAKPRRLGTLQKGNYRVLSVKEELRHNLIGKLRSGEELFPGVIGYEETVTPQIVNAILAGQDMIFLGERGQAKTRIIRSLIRFLDEETPVISGCEINDHPLRPVCQRCQELVAREGEQVEVSWLSREQRYGEKLATPDVTPADLIGEVDPIKVAEGRYLSDALTIHYGLIPRCNRGIFAINELPDLVERIQVGLFNIMEERDVQIKGYKIRLPLDVYIVATANPEDYTNRGRIITPLKDRYGAQIRTHYPTRIEDEIHIMEQERTTFDTDGQLFSIPQFMKEIIAEVTFAARQHGDINQQSGVSVRMSIGNYETLFSNALRRALITGEKEVVPRISDLPFLAASSLGKIELEGADPRQEGKIMEELVRRAVKTVFDHHFTAGRFEEFLKGFQGGRHVEVSAMTPSREYPKKLNAFNASRLTDCFVELGSYGSAAEIASAIEFILEGLHLHKKLNKQENGEQAIYGG